MVFLLERVLEGLPFSGILAIQSGRTTLARVFEFRCYANDAAWSGNESNRGTAIGHVNTQTGGGACLKLVIWIGQGPSMTISLPPLPQGTGWVS